MQRDGPAHPPEALHTVRKLKLSKILRRAAGRQLRHRQTATDSSGGRVATGLCPAARCVRRFQLPCAKHRAGRAQGDAGAKEGT